MPQLPKRSCLEPGCPALVSSGRCDLHAKAKQQTDDQFRGKTAERGYGADHRRMRPQCFERDAWRCVACGWEPDIVRECREVGIGLPPNEVVLEYLRSCFAKGERHLHMDHQIRIDVRPELRLDLDNVQTLCNVCHRSKTLQETRAGLAS